MKTLLLPIAITIAAMTLAGCGKRIQPPTDKGVCYAMAMQKDGKPRFNVVAENMPNMENCAAQLEGMRLRFARMGLRQDYVTGTYQGVFIFIRPEGVFTARSYGGPQFPALVRTGDGRLAIPGAMPQE